MAFKRSQNIIQNAALDDLITFFAETVGHLPEVKLDKLIYVAHLYYYATFGELLTKTRFFSLSYGPHAPTIQSALKRLVESKSIFFEQSRTSSDPVYSNPCLIIKACGPEPENLSSSCLNALGEVSEDWGDKPYKLILDYTTRTIPYLSTFYRDPIDWTLNRPCHELKHVLPYPERLCIHQFVAEQQTPGQWPDARCQVVSISVHEIAEIYLALCGERPDKIPAKEHVGFDLQSVQDALDKGESNSERGPGGLDEIEKACRITDSLLTSLSFGRLSARVALKTGMFFLKKQGYSFAEDVLEGRWPHDNSYEILKEWFGGVSVRVDTKL
ncbi:MAG: hypothetical protein COT06_11540 [Syntrophobacteraceae bacterium CG07_land_8_20_14_0_80_61_8]|nr:MAG: hypothetical protein COT06_11540 [Syntrophobacteraceae bacterium CG07_land_8_20_14_0_80_61_8]